MNGLPKNRLFSLFSVSSSGYYDWLKRRPSQRQIFNERLDQMITELFFEHKKRYGYRRIYAWLLQSGYQVSSERVRRRMKKLSLKARQHRQYRCTTDSNHHYAVADNILNRQFETESVNQVWVSDITYIKVQQNWLYLAIIIDLYSRKVIGWAMSNHINSQLVCHALMMALLNRGYPRQVILHSDRGSQYCSDQYQKYISFYQLTCSMSRKGNCWDNAVAESFFHTLKSELVYCSHFKNEEEAKSKIMWYIEVYYNRKRMHSSLDYLTPEQFENKAKIIA